jgi:hypothetical protein
VVIGQCRCAAATQWQQQQCSKAAAAAARFMLCKYTRDCNKVYDCWLRVEAAERAAVYVPFVDPQGAVHLVCCVSNATMHSTPSDIHFANARRTLVSN